MALHRVTRASVDPGTRYDRLNVSTWEKFCPALVPEEGTGRAAIGETRDRVASERSQGPGMRCLDDALPGIGERLIGIPKREWIKGLLEEFIDFLGVREAVGRFRGGQAL